MLWVGGGWCLLETASSVVKMQAVAEHNNARLKDRTCLTSPFCNEKGL